MNTDILIAAQKSLSPPEADRFKEVFFAANPHMRGAHVADILETLENGDAHLNIIEPLYDMHADDVPERGLLVVAGYLSHYIDGCTDKGVVMDYVRRIRHVLVAAKAA